MPTNGFNELKDAIKHLDDKMPQHFTATIWGAAGVLFIGIIVVFIFIY